MRIVFALLIFKGLLGAFDVFWNHEYREQCRIKLQQYWSRTFMAYELEDSTWFAGKAADKSRAYIWAK